MVRTARKARVEQFRDDRHAGAGQTLSSMIALELTEPSFNIRQQSNFVHYFYSDPGPLADPSSRPYDGDLY